MTKRTEKSKANGRQKSIANSSAEANQEDCHRDKAKYEAKHITEESCSQPIPKHPKTDSDFQQGQHELKLGEVVTTLTKIDFKEETVEYKNLSFTVQKDTEVIHGEGKGGTKITCYSKENQSEFSEKRRLKDLAKKHLERKSSR